MGTAGIRQTEMYLGEGPCLVLVHQVPIATINVLNILKRLTVEQQ